MKIKELLTLIHQEIELYKKLLKQNQELLDKKDKMDIDLFQKKIYNKDKLLGQIQKIDEQLNHLWENWDSYKEFCSENDKNNIRNLKKLIEKNLEIENIIIKTFEKFLATLKSKTIAVNTGKKAFNAYKTKKVNIPYFLNEKG